MASPFWSAFRRPGGFLGFQWALVKDEISGLVHPRIELFCLLETKLNPPSLPVHPYIIHPNSEPYQQCTWENKNVYYLAPNIFLHFINFINIPWNRNYQDVSLEDTFYHTKDTAETPVRTPKSDYEMLYQSTWKWEENNLISPVPYYGALCLVQCRLSISVNWIPHEF